MTSLDDLWGAVVADVDVVTQLRRAAHEPAQAYLLVGREGFGTRDAAKALGATLISAANDPSEEERDVELAAVDRHPSVLTVRRAGAKITTDQAREVVSRAALSPPEGALQLIVLTEFHLVGDAAPILLKTLEEPPASTVFIVLADSITPELVTIASRCLVFEFPPLSVARIEAVLKAAGCDDELARVAAGASGGDLDRAQLLVDDPHVVERHRFWETAVDRVSPACSSARSLTVEALERIDQVLEPLVQRHAVELAELEQQREEYGRSAMSTKDLDASHKRELRRVRQDELRAGLASMYQGVRSRDVSAEAIGEVGRAIGECTEAMTFNVNESLALDALFVRVARAVGT